MMTMLLNALVLFVTIAVFVGLLILCLNVGFSFGWWIAETVSKLMERK